MFSLGREGLNIRPPRVTLSSTVFTCLLVCVLYSDNCRGYASFKGSSELTPCTLMISWASDWRVSKPCTWQCENRSWWLPLWVFRHRMWDSPCSCSLTQFLCLWVSRITSMTSLINKNDRDICDRIYHVKSFTIVSDISPYGGFTLLFSVFIITSYHLRRCFVFYGGHTSKSSNVFTRFFIESVETTSPTIHPSVYISMVHHDNIYVFSFDRIFVCGYVLSFSFLYVEWKR